MHYPKYVKSLSLVNDSEECTTEWFVRLHDVNMKTKDGLTIETPNELLNMYFTLLTPNKVFKSRTIKSKNPWLRIQDL